MDGPHRGPAGAAGAGGAPVSAIIEAQNVVKSFGQTPALRGASLGVRHGEIVAVMGPSGSGKSTLLHCLAGILVPEEGAVWFGGQRLDTLGDDRRSALRRDRFGFVFQSGQLVPELTAEENVALPLLLSGTRRGPAMTAARKWFGPLGLDGLEHRRSGELSGGQAQRVALARGLVAGPEVLFADEPTGSLDSVSGELVMDLLTAAVREQGTTVVLVTHDARVAAYADREVIVRDGQVSSLTGADAVIGLGLRLVLSGGREAVIRFLVLAAAVGLGVGLLLTAVAGTNAVNAWNDSHAWMWTGTSSVPPSQAPAGIAPLWWHPGSDTFDGQTIDRFDVAATGTSSPVPPGITHDPGPGQYYASPALAALLRSTPANELADRYPGRLAGTIGDAALASPNSLVIIIGHAPAQLARTPGSTQVTSIATAVPGRFSDQLNPKGLDFMPSDPGIQSSGIDLILSVVALGMLTPVLIFIATATRLSAARREQRFAAMRLAGATRRQVSMLAAAESTVAGVLGVAAGFGIFFLLRAPVAGIPFFGQPFFPGQLSLSPPDILAVAIGVPVAAAVAARLALRRVQISPLGVARRVTPKPPRAWRVLPLLAGLADLGFFAVRGGQLSVDAETQVLVSGFLLIIVGLVIAGPWLTMAAARVMARRTSRPAALLAARRLADDPRAAFRAVSGLVLALFITTVAVVAITTQDAKDVTRFGSASAASVVQDQLADQTYGPASGGNPLTTGPGPAAPAARSRSSCARFPACRESSWSARTRGSPFPGPWSAAPPIPAAPWFRFRQAWSRARSSRPFPPSAAAPRGRQRRRSRKTGSERGACGACRPPGSPGQP